MIRHLGLHGTVFPLKRHWPWWSFTAVFLFPQALSAYKNLMACHLPCNWLHPPHFSFIPISPTLSILSRVPTHFKTCLFSFSRPEESLLFHHAVLFFIHTFCCHLQGRIRKSKGQCDSSSYLLPRDSNTIKTLLNCCHHSKVTLDVPVWANF